MLYYNTISELLHTYLIQIMQADVFSAFRLVGGTALSLQIGHRMSIDIDLFSDALYGSIDFGAIDSYIEENYQYASHLANIPAALGKSYIIGTESKNAIKLDVYYTDTFIQPAKTENNIRMATVSEIIAMKMDIIQRGGRKKDFWDIHELLQQFTISQMMDLHQSRYESTHDKALILENFKNFDNADDDLTPVCLRGKYWVFIKEDLTEAVEMYFKKQ